MMLSEYISEALNTATYEKIEDEEPYYGEIPLLKGVWASGKTLEECRENLRETLDDWILVAISRGKSIPVINGREIKLPELATA